MGFQFDGRSRLEAGVDGIAEVMDKGKPLARMIAVQVKATETSRYSSEDEAGFTYLLRPDDLAYWRGSNLPGILVLYRKSDETYFWKEVGIDPKGEDRRLGLPPAAEVTLIRGVLLDIGGVAFFRRVGMMLTLHQLVVFQHFRIPLQTVLAATGRWYGRHIARHNSKS